MACAGTDPGARLLASGVVASALAFGLLEIGFAFQESGEVRERHIRKAHGGRGRQSAGVRGQHRPGRGGGSLQRRGRGRGAEVLLRARVYVTLTF